MDWLKKHSKIYSVGAALVLLFCALETLQGVWSLFSDKPPIPHIVSSINTLSTLPRSLVILVFVVFIAISLWFLFTIYKQNTTKNPYIVADNVIFKTKDLLTKIHKRSLKLTRKAVKQFIQLFGFQDFWNINNSIMYTMREHLPIIEKTKKDLRGRKLSKNKVKKRKQIDDVFDRISPILDTNMDLDSSVRHANCWEDIPRQQNSEYMGILARRKNDSHWNRLFTEINGLKTEYPEIFKEDSLDKLIREYLDADFAGCSLILIVEVFSHFVPIENQPSEYIKSGANNPNVKVETRLNRIIGEIQNRIKEISKREKSDSKIEK
jgi:hypothetical protein